MEDYSGMSPRKRMAGGASSGNFGVKSYGMEHGGAVTPVSPAVGRTTELSDGERGIGTNVKGHGPQHGRQAAPDHGPVPDHFSRSAKV
jgi:hypothetical protein